MSHLVTQESVIVDGEALLRTIARLHRRATRDAKLETPALLRLLSLVAELGPARIGDLAVADSTSQPTMTAQIQRAESHGWVTRTPDPDDARASRIELSPAGQAALAKGRARRGAAVAPLLDTLGPRDAATLNRAAAILDKLLT